jgi:hypothetical protein
VEMLLAKIYDNGKGRGGGEEVTTGGNEIEHLLAEQSQMRQEFNSVYNTIYVTVHIEFI